VGSRNRQTLFFLQYCTPNQLAATCPVAYDFFIADIVKYQLTLDGRVCYSIWKYEVQSTFIRLQAILTPTVEVDCYGRLRLTAGSGDAR
jgi:hypothetical protein